MSLTTDALDEKAAEWIVLLTADDEADRAQAREGFELWKQADPRHAAVAEQMEGFVSKMHAVREHAGGRPHPVSLSTTAFTPMKGPSKRRKAIRHALVIALALAMPIWLTFQAYPPAYLMSDVRSSAGEWKTSTLPDGSSITLNGTSAVNVRFDDQRRVIELVEGEILIDVDKDASRPFLIETSHGSVRALGTRLIVSRREDSTVVTMLESRVSVQSAAQRKEGSKSVRLVDAGQRVRITPARVGALEDVDEASVSDAWKFRQLVVADRPLSEVLDELERHRSGRIQYDRAQIADIRVSALLPLDDTDRALQLLMTNFPQLRMRTITPYLVLIDVPASP